MPTKGKATVKVIIHGSTDMKKLIYAAEKFAKDILKEKKDEKKSIKAFNRKNTMCVIHSQPDLCRISNRN